MNPFFDSTEKVALLELEANQWIGTPFVKGAMVRGAGADCVHLIAGIYRMCGFLKDFTPGRYALDEGQHLVNSKVLAWFAARKDFERIPTDRVDLLAGDTLCFHLGRVEHHVGLMLTNGNFIHALPSRMAMISNLRESFYGARITAVFRPMEVTT
jgi:cell wall-associated NlpC family hydrolase